MISEQDLRDAARRLEKAALDALPEPKDCPAQFSKPFERKMKRLIFRTDHPVLCLLLRLLPVLLVLLLLRCCLFRPEPAPTPPPAVTPTETPAPSTPAPSAPAAEKTVVYRPTWLPKGCRADREALYETEGMIVYLTADGTEATFLYATQGDPAQGEDLESGRAVTVGDNPGVLRLGQGKGALNDLFWTDGELGAAFWISAPFPEDVLIRIAESVEAQ